MIDLIHGFERSQTLANNLVEQSPSAGPSSRPRAAVHEIQPISQQHRIPTKHSMPVQSTQGSKRFSNASVARKTAPRAAPFSKTPRTISSGSRLPIHNQDGSRNRFKDAGSVHSPAMRMRTPLTRDLNSNRRMVEINWDDEEMNDKSHLMSVLMQAWFIRLYGQILTRRLQE